MPPLLSLIAPPACLACRAPVPDGGPVVCGPCLARLPWLRGHRCPRCALPGHRGGCPAARGAFDRAWAPLAYRGPARDLVRALKFHAALPAAELMASQLAANLPPDVRPTSLTVVPVPPHPGRRRRRGYDPVELLAAGLAARIDAPLSGCLRRVDRAARQVGAGRGLRRRAGRIAVEVAGRAPPAAMLVDDVHTTGATLEACARALKAGGSARVVAVTYARTL